MKQEVLKMSEKFMKYVRELITDVDYVASGYPNDFLEVKMEQELPFRFYCSMQDGDWEEISNAAREQLIGELKDQKSTYSRSDHRYYMLDFHLASLGGL